MSEQSIFWTTGATGDGASAYTQAQVTDWIRRTFVSDNYATQGVLFGYNNALVVAGTSSPVTVGTGAAVVYGFPYENTASVNVSVSTPTIGTTGHRVVLRADWTAQTVRIVLLSASDGVATPPAVTQSAGATWEISLATLTITTGGVIAVTDARTYCHFASMVATENLDADAVTNTVLRNSGALSVIGRSANSTGDPADISAVAASDSVLRESGSALGFGTIAAAGIASNAVTTAKILDANVTDAKLRNSGALSVIGRSANSTGVPADISASAASDAVLRESGSTLGFGTIATAGIANSAVTTAKLATGAVTTAKITAAAVTETELATSVAGNGLAGGGGTALSVNVDGSTIEINADALRVKASGITDNELASNAVVTAKIANTTITGAKIANDAISYALLGDGAMKVYSRQGGDATHWSTAGTSNYTSLPDMIVQMGVLTLTGTSGGPTFAAAFSGKPIVHFNIINTVSATVTGTLYSVDTTGFVALLSDSNQTIHWVAYGPE